MTPRLDRLPEVTAALAARAAEHDRDGSFPADGIAAADAAGLLTATVAPRYGGPGTGLAGSSRSSALRPAAACPPPPRACTATGGR